MDWNSAYMEFITYLKLKNYSSSTLTNYRKMLKPFKIYLKQKEISDIRQTTRKNILEYRELVNNQKLTSTTKSIRIGTVRCFFKYLNQENSMLINPCEGITIKEGKRLPAFPLTTKEVKKILNQPNLSFMSGIRDRAILELLYSTGIRISECLSIALYDVNIKERVIHIREGKGARDRIVPVGKTAIRWLKEYIEKCRPKTKRVNPGNKHVFLSIVGNPISIWTFRQMFHKYRKKAGIKRKGVTCHSFRHAFATELLKNGADVVSVQKLLGHKNIETTIVYTKVIPKDLKNIHNKTHPRG